ncbi:MAG: hypothetical protein ABSC51_11105 [Gaiellaceae bacterium]|jgi:hypothetical protein
MEETALRLPELGFEQISRILKAYHSAARGSTETPVTLSQLVKRTAMNRSVVSSNNGFFVSLGLIEGGNAKRLTPLGVRAAIALDHPGARDAQTVWRTVVENSELEQIVDAIRIRQGMDEEALLSHIVLTAGVPKTSRWLTGARTIVDLLEFAGLLIETDGLFRTSQDSSVGGTSATSPAVTTGDRTRVSVSEPVAIARMTAAPGMVVNVHVWVDSREADFDALAVELKEFLAKLTTTE